ncbi:prolyl oligopeptidase family serine peptidase [Undibacterium sp. Xuan67W]|uniref:prolyl oligopeptidase family serine peptidase n=1 Tax=Undibacterium sp. Xuan67W TaxID=3413057 RepID=UPI003BF2FF86
MGITSKLSSGLKCLTLVSCLALLAACASVTTSSARPSPQRFDFAEGGQATYFSIDNHLFFTAGQSNQAQFGHAATSLATLVFVVPGSGCVSMGKYLPDYFRGLEGESGALRILILQKRHSQQDDTACSDAFIRDDHLSRWQADQNEFIGAQLRLLQRQGQHPRRIVMLGISEGAELAALLAATHPAITHLVMISNGGMQPLDAFRLLANQRNEAGDAGLLNEVQRIDEALLNTLPQTLGKTSGNAALTAAFIALTEEQILINGRSRQYWQELSQLRHSDNLLSLNKPILLCMGSADQAVPVESANWLERQFRALKKTNLQLHIYPDADHGLRTPFGVHLPDCLHQMDLWLEKS